MRIIVPVLILVLPIPARAGPWKVVGGHPVDDGSWPDAVALFTDDAYTCTGVLVAPDVVLTAAHCDFGLTHAVVGARDHAADGESIAIVATESHPNWWSSYDLAVVVLEHAAAPPPRPIALDCIAEEWLVDGAEVAIVGYGATNAMATVTTTLLHEARAVVSDIDCTGLDEGCQEAVSPGGELIAGGAGVDSCNGDSGGPLYLITEEGDFLVGTTSRATDTGAVPCGDGGIYVRADAVAAWVEQETGRTLPRPDCANRNHPPEPTHDAASVELGHGVAVVVHANDPDPDDRHVWTLASPPPFGSAEVSPDGRVWFESGFSSTGAARFVVEVADDGAPSRSARMTVEVFVEDAPIHRRECGHAGGSAPPVALLLPLAALFRRRARRLSASDRGSGDA